MSEEEMKNYIPNVEFVLIPASQLSSNVAYQRKCSRRFINRIEDNFDKNMLKPVRVSERDNQYWIWDGQHTVELLKKVSGNEDIPVWCMVYHGLQYEDEARLFSMQKDFERNLLGYEITKAKIEAKDQNALLVQSIVNAYGFRYDSHTEDKKIAATKAVEKVFNTYGEEVLARTMMLLMDTWEGRKEYLRGTFIKTLSQILNIYGEDIDDTLFADKMSTVSMREITVEGNRFALKGTDYTYALVSLYNKKTGKRLDVSKLHDC